MNTLGIALLWCVVQVTLVGLLAAGIYVLARRFWAAAAVPIVLAGLVMVVTLSLLALSPWPRWITQNSVVSATPVATAADAGARVASRVEVIGSALDQKAHSEPGQTDHSRSSGSALFWRALVDEFSRPQPVVQAEIWRWPALVALVLLSATLLGLGRLVLGLVVVRRERLESRPVHDKRLLELADELRAELGCRRSVELRECDRLATAATIGWRRPVLLVPSDWTEWTADERRAVLAHELAHVRSRDCLSLLLGQFGLALHFYHPLIHWLAARLRLEQELAADAAAASVSGGQRAYLMTIARLALRQQDRSLPWPAGTFFPSRNTFLRRIAMLRDNKLTFRRLSPVVHATVLGMVLFGGLIVAGLRGPGWRNQAVAQPPAMATASTVAIPENHGSQIDLSVVPASCNMFIAMRPADAFARPELAPMAELFEAAIACPKGTHAADIRQITMILPGEIPTGPREIVVFQFLKPFAASSVIENVAPGMAGITVKEHNGKKMYCNDNHGVLMQYDERTLISGSEKAMDAYLAGNLGVCPSWLPKKTWDAFRADHVVLAYNMPALQRDAKAFVNHFSQRWPEPLKTMLSTVAPLWEDTTCVVAGLQLGQTVRIHGTALAKGEKDAEAIEQTVNAVRTLALNALREAVKTAKEQGKKGNSFEQFAAPKLDQFLSALRIERAGTAVLAEGSIDMETVRKFL
ncbi:MAG: M56 family metallopeptidase [Pirellulales bacterium]|nr:M56 family metallopeptidase [Pirellulales bacterium]